MSGGATASAGNTSARAPTSTRPSAERGPGTDGHPVLIQPSGDGAYRVIGGAGGKLNYLKLTGVKHEAHYKGEAAKRARARSGDKKRRAQQDKEAGLAAGKAQAKQNIRDFLYVALHALKDLEKQVGVEAEALGLERPLALSIGPQNVLGIEKDEYGAELTRIVVWIGEIQWMRQNGFAESDNPILKPLDHIECRDALLNADGSEAAAPPAECIVGNPPFLGDKVDDPGSRPRLCRMPARDLRRPGARRR